MGRLPCLTEEAAQNVEDPDKLYGMMVKCTSDPNNKDDNDVYEHLQSLLTESSGAMAAATAGWKQVKQLKAQKKELVRGACSNGRLGLRLSPRL